MHIQVLISSISTPLNCLFESSAPICFHGWQRKKRTKNFIGQWNPLAVALDIRYTPRAAVGTVAGQENGPNKIFCRCLECWWCIILHGVAWCGSHICLHYSRYTLDASHFAQVSQNTYYVVSGILLEASAGPGRLVQIRLLCSPPRTGPLEWLLIMLSAFSLESGVESWVDLFRTGFFFRWAPSLL